MKIFFSSTSNIKPEPTGYSFYLVPTTDGWNDYGTKNILELIGYLDGNLIYTSRQFTKIKFFDQQREAEAFGKKPVRVKNIGSSFISQCVALESYNEILNILKLKETILFFSVVRDYAVLNSLGRFDTDPVEKEKVFYKSLTRYSDPYSAANGCSSLFQIANNLKPNISCSFRLDHFSNSHNIKIDFPDNPISQNRISVLVGKNGVGKSQSLRNICIAEIEGILEDNNRSAFNRVMAISNVLNDDLPKLSELPLGGGLFFKYINLVIGTDKHSSTQAIIDILRQATKIDNGLKIDLLRSSLLGLLEYEDIFIPLKDGINEFRTIELEGTHYFPVSEYVSLSEQRTLELTEKIDLSKPIQLVNDDLGYKFILLSTGQKFFLNIALKVVGYISSKSLLLFEEPETYLHPNLEVDFHRFLSNILALTDSYAVLSTHSVYLVREVMSTQVQILEKRNGRIEVYRPSIQTFGASLDAISGYIFGDLGKDKVFEESLNKLGNLTDEEMKRYVEFLGEDAIFYLINKSE